MVRLAVDDLHALSGGDGLVADGAVGGATTVVGGEGDSHEVASVSSAVSTSAEVSYRVVMLARFR